MKINTILQELREKIEELQELVDKQPQLFPPCNYIQELNYVNLSDGTTEDKLNRIINQIVGYKINIIPTPKDSQVVRSAIVKELGAMKIPCYGIQRTWFQWNKSMASNKSVERRL